MRPSTGRVSGSTPGERPLLRVALAPDAPLVISGLTGMLTTPGAAIEVVSLVTSTGVPLRSDAVLYDPQRTHPADLGLPTSGSGVRGPLLIAVSWSTRADVITTAQEHGAVGLLSKELEVRDLVGAVRALCAGQRTRYVVEPSTSEGAGPPSLRPAGLTEREHDVLSLITQGMTNEDIAKQLYLSINSVKTYIRTAYRKIGATRRPQAVLWGVQQGLMVGTGMPSYDGSGARR